jgi:hypothetical protein
MTTSHSYPPPLPSVSRSLGAWFWISIANLVLIVYGLVAGRDKLLQIFNDFHVDLSPTARAALAIPPAIFVLIGVALAVWSYYVQRSSATQAGAKRFHIWMISMTNIAVMIYAFAACSSLGDLIEAMTR